MCGVAGILQGERSSDPLPRVIRAMTDAMRSRGPDDRGHWHDAEAGVALGHRRLSVIDLSPAGAQPMSSETGRFRMSYNGEVYNFVELRQELESIGHRFRGDSDTEVVLAAIEEWGLPQALTRFVGMFALVLWDRRERRLHIARDRFGIKPLYYGFIRKTFACASDLCALEVHPGFCGDIDRDALTLLLRYNYIPAPYSVYKGFRKLQPGTVLTVCAEDCGSLPDPSPYWSARDAMEDSKRRGFRGSAAEAAEVLEELLQRAVRMRTRSDVPVGAFLSGGIDSATIVALMQSQRQAPVRTFSIGFAEKAYDESSHARAVAHHLGTKHVEDHLSPGDALSVIPRLPQLYSEPFADSSQIAACYVSQLARKYVTVTLAGDGGDELFGGYNRYPRALAAWQSTERAQAALHDRSGDSCRARQMETRASLYLKFVSYWKDPCSIVLNAVEPRTAFDDRSSWAKLDDFVEHMMFLDTITYMPDDILAKVDRASMGVGLEVRTPFLDHRVATFVWGLPVSWKIKSGTRKRLLRRVLEKYVPRGLVDRPKQGFAIPLDSWLRGPLRDWAESLLEESRMRQQGFVDPRPVAEMWRRHLHRDGNRENYLWSVLMFQAWYESRSSRRAVPDEGAREPEGRKENAPLRG